jgi:hypothetical protein
MADFECKNVGMAITALDTIAASMEGTQRAAVLAVKTWVQKNAPAKLSCETREKLLSIFNAETEGQRKAREWYNRGSRTVGGELVSTEPEGGAEWTCVWNAKTKRWEPPYPPPLISGGRNR